MNPSTNQLEIALNISYQGKEHNFLATIDLDKQLHSLNDENFLHNWIASSNQIDPYSYLYEAIFVEPIEFISASGEAAKFLAAGQFDFAGFAAQAADNLIQPGLVAIAKEFLNDDLHDNPALLAALRAAYKLGANG